MSSRISQRIRSRRNQCRKLLVEAGRVAAAAGPAALLVGPLGNGVGDAAPTQPGAYRAGAVALVAQHLSGSQPGPSRPEAGHPDRLHHGGELRAVVRVAARQHEAERAPQGIAGQAAPGTSECGDAEPPFRAPPACWRARTTVESTDTSQSISPAASARAARSIRSKVPSRAHRRKTVRVKGADLAPVRVRLAASRPRRRARPVGPRGGLRDARAGEVPLDRGAPTLRYGRPFDHPVHLPSLPQ